MAVGDLEGKIGELNGQLRTLIPTLESLGKKSSDMGERLAAVKENLKTIWEEIHAIKRREAGGAKKWWEVVLAGLSAVIGAVVTVVVLKLTKGTP
jgi:hypothetical protein